MPISINMNINKYKNIKIYIGPKRRFYSRSAPVGVFGVVVVAWCGDDVVVLSCWWCCRADCGLYRVPGPKRRLHHRLGPCYDFYPTSHFSPFLSLPSTNHWAIFVHCYLFISFDYYLLLTRTQQCTVCLLMHSLLTYAQHAYLRAAFLYSM